MVRRVNDRAKQNLWESLPLHYQALYTPHIELVIDTTQDKGYYVHDGRIVLCNWQRIWLTQPVILQGLTHHVTKAQRQLRFTFREQRRRPGTITPTRRHF